MSKINLLDCTLRDGAYINNGNFGSNVIKGITHNLNNSNVALIEVGWLKDFAHKKGSTYFETVEDIIPYLAQNKRDETQYIAMIHYDRYNLDKLTDYNGKSINSIRMIFPKEKFEEAIEFSKQIKAKGYKLYLQAVNTQSYSNNDLVKISEKVNEIECESLSIVDTFGVMYKADLKRIFMILNNNIDKNIKIGFHSHNNLQMSFALSIEFLELGIEANREIIVDSSLCGMGRGAGNTCTELVTNYINSKYNGNFDTDIIMDTIEIYMKDFINKYKWGYNIPFCIAGQLCAHVNNVEYLQNTYKTNFYDIKKILQLLPKNERKICNYDKLEKVYLNYIKKKSN